jgi:hydantoinase/carbamoylase family amidase
MQRADELAACTEVAGEITRPYGSASLVRAGALIEGWMRDAGLEVRRDAAGNVIGRRGPTGAPAMLLGSHFDSVRNAGRYDGPLGILVALAAAGRTAASALPIEVIAFSDEEGMRFRSSFLASRAWAGLMPPEELEITDETGVTLAEAMRASGGDPAAVSPARRSPQGILGYLEVHIEQGPVLQDEDLPVGVVTAIAGQSRGFVEITGRAGHAGNTPPRLRADALVAASDVVIAIEDEMHATAGLVATVGKLDCHPNVGNVIPGRVTLSYDVRHQDDVVREAAVERIARRAYAIAQRRGVRADPKPLEAYPAVPMSPTLRARLCRAVAATGCAVRELPSGAGHDAMTVADVTPDVAMLFVRCRDGVSHHPDESVREDDVAVAIDVVAAFLEETARG